MAGTSPLITPVLDEFRIVLGERLNIVNPIPSFNVRVTGDLLVSGVVDGNLENLRPQGVISVERGQLDLLSNLFFYYSRPSANGRVYPGGGPIESTVRSSDVHSRF